MKTITELQKQIRTISEDLSEIAIDVAALGEKNVDTRNIDFKHIRAIGCRNPIEEHCAEKTDEYVKKQYITMLISLIHVMKNNTENAWLLVQRIASGIGYKEDISQLQADAMNLTDEQFDNFTKTLSENNLGNAFALDSMLMYLNSGGNDNNVIEFIAALMELLKVSKKEITELMQIAISIQEQSRERYIENDILKEATAEVLSAGYCYVKQYYGLTASKDKNERKYILKYIRMNGVYNVGTFNNGPLSWRVIGEEDKHKLLLCESCIGVLSMDSMYEKSCIREFLTDSFYNKAFNDIEKSHIVVNKTSDIKDKIFLLSKDEVKKYMPEKNMRIFNVEGQCTDWWIRTSSEWSNCYISHCDDICNVTHGPKKSIRPAMWITLE